MRDDDHDGGREAAQDRRAEEREDDLRQAGRFPHNVHFVRPEVPLVLSKQAREQIAAAADRGLAISALPAALPAGPVLGRWPEGSEVVDLGPRPVPILLDTDENGDLRGRVAVDDNGSVIAIEPVNVGDLIAEAISQAEDASSLEEDDEWHGVGDDPRGGSFGDPERAPPDPDDEAVIRHATATVERPAPLLPAAELFFAAACKATSAVRADTTTTAGLEAAHRAARLAADLARALVVALEDARDLRARQWPRECGCGAIHLREGWLALRSQGVQRDPSGDLDLRCCSGCGSTLAMPVSVP